MALLSRGSLVLNTTMTAEPSTLGGFPGGGAIWRDPGEGERLLSPPSPPPTFPLEFLINGSLQDSGLPSYNVNGPGSANYRKYIFTITTSADDIDEVQQVSAHRERRTGRVGNDLDMLFVLKRSSVARMTWGNTIRKGAL